MIYWIEYCLDFQANPQEKNRFCFFFFATNPIKIYYMAILKTFQDGVQPILCFSAFFIIFCFIPVFFGSAAWDWPLGNQSLSFPTSQAKPFKVLDMVAQGFKSNLRTPDLDPWWSKLSLQMTLLGFLESLYMRGPWTTLASKVPSYPACLIQKETKWNENRWPYGTQATRF